MNVKHAALLSALVWGLSTGPAWAVDTDPVVATVNGHEIRLSDVENARNQLPSQLQNAPLRDIYPVLLESLIDTRLAADKATRLGYHETPEFKNRMAQVSDQILQRIMMARHIEQHLTDELILERYQKLAQKAGTQFEIHARHILVESEDRAKELIAMLDDGQIFAELAAEHSTGPSRSRGGDLGWFGPGQMVEPFEAAAMALDVGAYTNAPVQTKFGWHVILVEERRPFPVPSYQEAREVIAKELLSEIGGNFMTTLRGESKIEKKSFAEVVKALQD